MHVIKFIVDQHLQQIPRQLYCWVRTTYTPAVMWLSSSI